MDRSTSSPGVLASVDVDAPTVIISKMYLPLTEESLALLKQTLQGFSFKGIRTNPAHGWLITFSNDQRGAKHCRKVFMHVSSCGWQARISEAGPCMRSNQGSVFDADASVSSRTSAQNDGSHKRRRLMSSEHDTAAPANTLALHGYSNSIVSGLQPPKHAISKSQGSFKEIDKRTKNPSDLHSNKRTADSASEWTATQARIESVHSANLQSPDNVMTRPTTPMALLMRAIMLEPGAPRGWTSFDLFDKIRERHQYYAEVFPQKTLKSNVSVYLSTSTYFQKVQGSCGRVPGHPAAYLWELAPERSKQTTCHEDKSAKIPRRDMQAIQDAEPIDPQRVDETYYVKSSFSAQFEICTRRAHEMAWNNLEVFDEACHAGTIYKAGETARIMIDDDSEDGDYAHIFALRKTENLGAAAAVLWYKDKSDPALKKTPGALRDLTNEQGQYLLTTHVDIVSVESFAGLASNEEKTRLSTTRVIDIKSKPWKIRASDDSHVSWMRQYVPARSGLEGARVAAGWQDRRASVTSMEDTTLIDAGDGSPGKVAAAKSHDEEMHQENLDLGSEVQRLRSQKEALQSKVDQLQKDVKDLQRGSQGMMQLESRVEALEARETQMKEIRDFLVGLGHAELVGGRAGQEAAGDAGGTDE